jgi:hypothetical protein
MSLWMLAAAMLAQGSSGAAQLTPGTVTVAPLNADQGPAETRRAIAEQVERALLDADFTTLPPGGRGRYTARVSVTRTPRGTVASAARESGADALIGNWGAGLSVTMPSNKTRLRGLIVTELTIELIRRGETAPAWTGRAATAQAEGSAADSPAQLGAKLARAALRRFPAQDAGAISVP